MIKVTLKTLTGEVLTIHQCDQAKTTAEAEFLAAGLLEDIKVLTIERGIKQIVVKYEEEIKSVKAAR